MKQSRILLPDEDQELEHIKHISAELKRIDSERKALLKELYGSVMKLDHKYRFDLIHDNCGKTEQKYILEACKEHVPELMKEAEK